MTTMASDSSAAAAPEKPQVFLEGDEEIRGQKYVCLSFLTPNRGILRNKELFFFSKFMEFYSMDYKIRSTESFVMGQFREIQNLLSDVDMQLRNADSTDISDNKSLAISLSERITALRGEVARKTAADLETYVKANLQDFKESNIVESYERYMFLNRQRLEDEFHKANNFQTTMHGLKVRGVYSSSEQAAARAKALNKKDPYFNVYVADVGEWLPWDPEPEEVKDQEYQSNDLNKLMQAYKENAAKRDEFFEEEKRQKVAAAAAEVKAAKESKGLTLGLAAATAAAKAAAAPAKAPEFGLQKEAAEAVEAAGDLFSKEGHGDLAIARKAAAAAAAASSGETISHA